MRKSLISPFKVTLFLVGVFYSKAQDPQFSQFYANQVLLNPAFTGAAQGPRLAINYRRQWVAIPGSFKTFATAFDMPLQFGRTHHGIGLTAMVDQAGEGNLTKLDILLNYSYQIALNDENVIRLGLAGGIQQASIDLLLLRFPDQIDPTTGFVDANGVPNFSQEIINMAKTKPSRITEDVTAGAVYYNKYAFLGFTVHHITQPRQTFISSTVSGEGTYLPMRFSVYAGVEIPLDPHAKEGTKSFIPTLLYKRQGPFQQLDAGFYFNTDPVVMGVWYRGLNNPDAVIGLIGVRQGVLSIGYSYDYTISSLTNRISGGSHEVAIVIEFERTKKSKFKRRTKFPCPRF